MTKPAHKHINAITRAQHLLETGIDVSNKPMLAKCIRKDIDLLCEVRNILYEAIENPTLPFLYDDPGQNYISPNIGEKSAEPVLNPIEDEPNEAS